MTAVVVKALWIYGLATVVAMLIAALIKVIVAVLGRLDRAPAPRPVPQALPPAAAAAIPPEHVAAIGAAVCASIGAHRILHIESQRGAGRWGAEGRSVQHRSHAVPTHKPQR